MDCPPGHTCAHGNAILCGGPDKEAPLPKTGWRAYADSVQSGYNPTSEIINGRVDGYDPFISASGNDANRRYNVNERHWARIDMQTPVPIAAVTVDMRDMTTPCHDQSCQGRSFSHEWKLLHGTEIVVGNDDALLGTDDGGMTGVSMLDGGRCSTEADWCFRRRQMLDDGGMTGVSSCRAPIGQSNAGQAGIDKDVRDHEWSVDAVNGYRTIFTYRMDCPTPYRNNIAHAARKATPAQYIELRQGENFLRELFFLWEVNVIGYKTYVENNQCYDCPPGYTCNGVTKTQCASHKAVIDNQCVSCPSGHTCSGGVATPNRRRRLFGKI